ncbi:MAG: rhomboid family intramembrane serine protease [Planctomycetota bacterium]|jgi:membrane associated rhomboid family serine protease
MQSSLWDRLMLGFRRLPVSWLLLMVCALLHGSFIYLMLFPSEQGSEGARLGALHVLRLVDYPEIDGFFELWQGQWWRLPVSALHHGDLVHLLCNAAGLWILGGMLEPRLGRVRYSLFLAGGLIISLLPEAAVEQPAVGISGLLYAMFGLLLVLRTVDERVREQFHPMLIVWGFAWLFLCVPLTMLGIMPIANGGHLCGIVYGALVGWLAFIVAPRQKAVGWMSLAAVHVGAAAAIAALIAPTWKGSYWGWRAVTETRPELWLKAVERDPRMINGWKAVIADRLTDNDIPGAWDTALQAAMANRSDSQFDDIVRELFRTGFASADERATALDALHSTFGDESAAWLKRFRLPQFEPIDELPLENFVELPPLDVPFEGFGEFVGLIQHVPGITAPRKTTQQRPTIDPDDPRSARYGEVL